MLTRALERLAGGAAVLSVGLFAATAVEGAGPEAALTEAGATVLLINDAHRTTALDAELVAVSPRRGLPLARLAVARGLRPGEVGPAVEAPEGAARLEVRLFGDGEPRVLYKRLRLEASRHYCGVVVDGFDPRLVVLDVTRQTRRTLDLGGACRDAATALGAMPASVPPPVAAARAHLADESDVPAASVRLLAFEATVWPDSALGCPAPGEVYAQVLVPGYWVLMEVAGVNVEYHTDDGQAARVLRCEGAMVPSAQDGR